MALRGFDARVLVWLLLVVFATGMPLMVVFDGDPAAHRAVVEAPIWQALRTAHATATLALVIGTLGHVAVRWRQGSDKGLRSGAIALAAVALASITGALSTQTDDADAVARTIGIDAAPATVAAVTHIAYATVFVLLTLYFHVARWGWSHVLGQRSQATWAVAIAAALGLVLPTALPGQVGGGATFYLVPPWPVLSLWTFLAAVGFYLGAMAIKKPRPEPRHSHD